MAHDHPEFVTEHYARTRVFRSDCAGCAGCTVCGRTDCTVGGLHGMLRDRAKVATETLKTAKGGK